MSSIFIENVSKLYRGSTLILDNVSFKSNPGEFVVIVGPSGCGKTTLLRVIAGLERVSSGQVYIDGVDVTTMAPDKRQVAMVFQSYALYPHMSVYANIAFAIEQSAPKDVVKKKVMKACNLLQLEHLLDRMPKELSGGQRQRVAIGRCLVREPQLFLFDEPLSNLDTTLRTQMRYRIARLKQQLHAGMVYVTHDQVEAMTLADKIVVMNDGRVEQIGTPYDIYNNPQTRFVANFVGSVRMNFLQAHIVRQTPKEIQYRLASGDDFSAPSRAEHLEKPETQVLIGVRPEDVLVRLVRGKESGVVYVSGTLKVLENLGSDALLHIDVGALSREKVLARVADCSKFSIGQGVYIGFFKKNFHTFVKKTGVVLPR